MKKDLHWYVTVTTHQPFLLVPSKSQCFILILIFIGVLYKLLNNTPRNFIIARVFFFLVFVPAKVKLPTWKNLLMRAFELFPDHQRWKKFYYWNSSEPFRKAKISLYYHSILQVTSTEELVQIILYTFKLCSNF